MNVFELQSPPEPCLDCDYLMQALNLTVDEARGLIMTAQGKIVRYGYRDWLGNWTKYPKIDKKSKDLLKCVV